MILKFSLVISLVCNKDTAIEALVPASVFTIVLSCLVVRKLLITQPRLILIRSYVDTVVDWSIL